MSKVFSKAEREECRASLKELLQKATTDSEERIIIYTVLRRVSANGTSRMISPVIIDASTSEPVNIAFDYVRSTTGRLPTECGAQWAVKVGGCGMDMGFHLAHQLAAHAGIGLKGFVHRWL